MYLDDFGYLNNIILGDLPKESGVYMILCKINGKSYIGSSFDIYNRVKNHFNDLIFDRHVIKELNKDFKEYGIENFEVFQLVSCDEELRLYLEGYYIKKYNSINNGYNTNNAGTENYYEKDNETLIYGKPKKVKSQIKLLENKCKEFLNDSFENSQVLNINNLINDYRIMITECLSYEGLLKLIEIFKFNIYIESNISSFYYKCNSDALRDVLNGTFFRCNPLLSSEYYDLTTLNINNIYIECPGFKDIEIYKAKVKEKNKKIEDEINDLKEEQKNYSEEYIELTREINSFYTYMYINENYRDLKNLRKKCYSKLNNIKKSIDILSNKKIYDRTENKHVNGFLLANAFKSMNKIIDLK